MSYTLNRDDTRPRPCICDKATLKPFLCNIEKKTVNSAFTPCLVREDEQVVLAYNKEDAIAYMANGKPVHAVLPVCQGGTGKYFGACMSGGEALQAGKY